MSGRWLGTILGIIVGLAIGIVQMLAGGGWPWGVSLPSDIAYACGRLIVPAFLGGVVGWAVSKPHERA